MGTTYVFHIVAGGLGLLSGYLALFAVKGATVHRRSGMVFVYAMLATSVGHLWRMSTALFIAALSFFIGQADVIPPVVRIRPLLALPVVLVLATMVYWLWRVRLRRSLRGIIVARIADAPMPVPSGS